MNRSILLAALLTTACAAGDQVPTVETGITARIMATPPASGDDLVVDSLVVQVEEIVFDADGPNGSISISGHSSQPKHTSLRMRLPTLRYAASSAS